MPFDFAGGVWRSEAPSIAALFPYPPETVGREPILRSPSIAQIIRQNGSAGPRLSAGSASGVLVHPGDRLYVWRDVPLRCWFDVKLQGRHLLSASAVLTIGDPEALLAFLLRETTAEITASSMAQWLEEQFSGWPRLPSEGDIKQALDVVGLHATELQFQTVQTSEPHKGLKDVHDPELPPSKIGVDPGSTTLEPTVKPTTVLAANEAVADSPAAAQTPGIPVVQGANLEKVAIVAGRKWDVRSAEEVARLAPITRPASTTQRGKYKDGRMRAQDGTSVALVAILSLAVVALVVVVSAVIGAINANNKDDILRPASERTSIVSKIVTPVGSATQELVATLSPSPTRGAPTPTLGPGSVLALYGFSSSATPCVDRAGVYRQDSALVFEVAAKANVIVQCNFETRRNSEISAGVFTQSNNSVTISCRSSGDGNYRAVFHFAEQIVQIVKEEKLSFTYLATVATNRLGTTGWVRIGFECKDTTLTAKVNNVAVASAVDATLGSGSGWIGLSSTNVAGSMLVDYIEIVMR